MQERALCASDNAKKNAVLIQKLGPAGFRILKSCYSLLRHPAEKAAQLRRLSDLERIAVGMVGLPFDRADWRRRFRRMILTSNHPRVMPLAESFYTDDLRLLHPAGESGTLTPPADPHCPIVLLAAKNERVRILAQLRHYRAIGVERFAIIDNGSTDGTKEILQAQADVDLFESGAKFGSTQKAAWLDRLAAAYGTERWFLWADADEFFAWKGMETESVADLCRRLEARGEYKLRSFMLDLYPAGALLDPARRDEDFLTDSVYFDGDSDAYLYYPEIGRLTGGMRNRLFDLPDITLSKITLLHFGGDRMLTGAHNIYPHEEDCTGAISSALLHYKFLPRDMEKYRAIVAAGTYANGSEEYRRYLERFGADPDLSAEFSGSLRYTGADVLSNFAFMKTP